ncbi:MAG: class III poly(R)-hydroxyalkanoic acid synthase subunit PhaC [Bacteroidia bacterium]|nr:class III poly(R)-hydroxyalkanoic acid synthase subunit PhaC [Bacteroidia bacterium]
MDANTLAAQAAENMNTLRNWYQNLADIKEVDIATAPRETVWRDGKVQMYHFTRETPATVRTPLVISYALVNRWEMMDLQPDRSLIRKMLSEGLDVYVIDWGYAGLVDRFKTMEDYIDGHIDDAIDYVRRKHQIRQVNLLGVCQGGTFSVIYAALHPEKVKNLITMVTPVDFGPDEGLLFRWSRAMDIDEIVDGFNGVVPGDFLNVAFDLLKPMGKVRKYAGLPRLAQDKSALENYLRMEKWVSDGPSQAGEAYRKFIKDLYQGNKLIKGEFELGGKRVDLAKITMPLLNIYAKEDHLVPPPCSVPLNSFAGSQDKTIYEFPGGHIGVFVGSRSQKELAPAIARWLGQRDP